MAISLNCKNCGKKFIATTHGKKFCSEECKKSYRHTYNKTCANCGDEFIAYHKNARYCSKTCRDESRRTKVTNDEDINIDPKWLRRK